MLLGSAPCTKGEKSGTNEGHQECRIPTHMLCDTKKYMSWEPYVACTKERVCTIVTTHLTNGIVSCVETVGNTFALDG